MKTTVNKSFTGKDVSFALDDSAPEGTVKAVISRFGIVDRDGDVVEKSAFVDGQPVKMAAWGHEWNRLPIGRGVIKVTNDSAIFEGQFFINTTHGKDAYETVKQLGDLQEWSWGFTIPAGGSRKGAKDGRPVRFITGANIYEVCPVLVGANQETETLAIKSADVVEAKQCDESHTIADMCAMMKAEMSKRLDDGADSADMEPMMGALRSLEYIAQKDKMGDAMNEGNMAESKPMVMSTEEREALLAEQVTDLIKSYDELGVNISAFIPTPSRTYAEHSMDTIEAVKNLTTRTKSLADLRAKDGRSLGKSSRELLESIKAGLGELLSSIDALAAPDAEETSSEEEQTTVVENNDQNKSSQEAELKRARALKVAQARSRLFASN